MQEGMWMSPAEPHPWGHRNVHHTRQLLTLCGLIAKTKMCNKCMLKMLVQESFSYNCKLVAFSKVEWQTCSVTTTEPALDFLERCALQRHQKAGDFNYIDL